MINDKIIILVSHNKYSVGLNVMAFVSAFIRYENKNSFLKNYWDHKTQWCH